jgi:AhpC/TSA family
MLRQLPKMLQASLLTGAMLVATIAPARAQSKRSEGTSMPKVGDMAPDFKLNYFDGTSSKEVSLSQYRGKKNVVLAFFIFAFTGG